ncbi:MAG: T9SS type A sorting domain-containing protein [Flavobacteriaceae bacterium]|nr:T9SS type A sorting domain-containing protein [Flavobacteriaceae bacterium]
MQAFWVQATRAGASIATTMATNGTVSSSPAYYKTIHDNLIVTVTKVGDSATTDRLWVANILGTSDGFDGAYDAWKMTNGPAMPNVFTWDLGERIAINATQIDAAKVLPMGFSYAVAGEKFGVRLEQVTGGQYYDVYLEDRLNGSYHDLNQSDYAFTHQGWTQEDPRFALHFSLSTVGVEEPNAADLFVAYQNQDRIMLRSIGEGFSAYRLYGLNGQELSSGPLTSGMQSIAAPTSAGLYLIEADGPQGSLRQKIIITY